MVFGAFVVAIAYLVAASLTRRSAPSYAASPVERTRAADWERVGDTITVDASNGDAWQYLSLSRGRVLVSPDTGGWEIAAQRYRLRAAGTVVDLGVRAFDHAAVVSGLPAGALDTTSSGSTFGHWYRYNMLTHLLEPNDHLYSVRIAASGRIWKVALVSYYCPGLDAGCVTIRYAPLDGNSSP